MMLSPQCIQTQTSKLAPSSVATGWAGLGVGWLGAVGCSVLGVRYSVFGTAVAVDNWIEFSAPDHSHAHCVSAYIKHIFASACSRLVRTDASVLLLLLLHQQQKQIKNQGKRILHRVSCGKKRERERGHRVLGLRAGTPIPLSQCPRVLLATVATICQTHFLCNFGPKVAKIFARLAKNKAAPYDPSRHPHTHTRIHTHTHVCPRLLCRTLQLNPFLIFLAINFYHFGISLWNATPTRNHLRPLTIYVHNGFACVCVPGQTKVFFSSFFAPIMKKPQDKNEPNK